MTIDSNETSDHGGGVFINRESGEDSSAISIKNSTLRANSTNGEGGGIWIETFAL